MTPRRFRCAIEDLAAWHPHLYVESYGVAFVAVTGQYSVSPASFLVECEDIESRWLGKAHQLTLEVSWTEETINTRPNGCGPRCRPDRSWNLRLWRSR
jgi:hypothetical protein